MWLALVPTLVASALERNDSLLLLIIIRICKARLPYFTFFKWSGHV